MRANDLIGYGPVGTNDPVQLLPCPFCGGRVFLHHGYNGIAFITCGQRDDGSDGCGAAVSFRPNVQGSAAAAAWNKRPTAQGKEHEKAIARN